MIDRQRRFWELSDDAREALESGDADAARAAIDAMQAIQDEDLADLEELEGRLHPRLAADATRGESD